MLHAVIASSGNGSTFLSSVIPGRDPESSVFEIKNQQLGTSRFCAKMERRTDKG
jgi:hypothetical protein